MSGFLITNDTVYCKVAVKMLEFLEGLSDSKGASS